MQSLPEKEAEFPAICIEESVLLTARNPEKSRRLGGLRLGIVVSFLFISGIGQVNYEPRVRTASREEEQ